MPLNIDPRQNIDMVLFGEMHGSSFRGKPSLSPMLTRTDQDLQPTLGNPTSNNLDTLPLFGDVMMDPPGDFAQAGRYHSPAFAQPTSMSSSGTSYTVSPAELHSGPGSDMMTYHSTPATNFSESPAVMSAQYSNQTSPEFGFQTPHSPYANDEFDQTLGGYQSTAGFFPELELAVEQQAAVAQPSPEVKAAKPRKATSSSGSPASPPTASPAGINKRKTKRSVPLGPIHVPPGDLKKEKTKRNTLAARKSRAKKVEYIEGLEAEVERLRHDNGRLRQDCDDYKQRVLAWEQRALNAGLVEGIQD
ncbi:MAG: hypothetical protein Q9200_002256 [Gallowayella weberi]